MPRRAKSRSARSPWTNSAPGWTFARVAGDQAVDDADALAAGEQRFGQVGSDETGTAGDDVQGHGVRKSARSGEGERTDGGEEGCRGPVSRILCPSCARRPGLRRACDALGAAIIPLGPRSLAASSNLPGRFGRAVLERVPIWSCSVRGFACHVRCRPRGALLPHLFTLTASLRPCGLSSAGGIFSVPLVRRVAPPGNYPAHCPAEFGLSSEPCGPAIACSPAARRHSSRLPGAGLASDDAGVVAAIRPSPA